MLYTDYYLDAAGESKLRLYSESADCIDTGKCMILICPGGGFAFHSEREMEPVAERFMEAGCLAAVLLYGIGIRARNNIPLYDAAKAVSLIREKADLWGVEKDKIILCGFSAGGYVAAELSVNWHRAFLTEKLGGKPEDYKPNGLLLAYPVIDVSEVNRHLPYIENFCMANKNVEENRYVYTENGETYIDFKKLMLSYLTGRAIVSREEEEALNPANKVDGNTPPVFLWHTSTDNLVWASNSLLFASMLEKHRIPYEMHIFGTGYHGISLADETTADQNGNGIVPQCQCWMALALQWIDTKV